MNHEPERGRTYAGEPPDHDPRPERQERDANTCPVCSEPLPPGDVPPDAKPGDVSAAEAHLIRCASEALNGAASALEVAAPDPIPGDEIEPTQWNFWLVRTAYMASDASKGATELEGAMNEVEE